MVSAGAAKYWLVNHPLILNFEWKRGITLGASPLFLFVTVVCYIFFTCLFLYRLRSSSSSSRTTTTTTTTRGRWMTFTLSVKKISTVVYNVMTFTLSLLMVVGCSLSIQSQMPDPHWIICFPADETPTRGPVFFWGYVFYLSKILEFTDTVLILLSRSSGIRRLSFLHVFHHSMVLIMSFIWVDTPLSTLPLGIITNAAVHTVMYFYYLMCSLGIRPSTSWKKMVTNLQIAQFVFAFFVGALALYYHLLRYTCSGSTFAWTFMVVFNTSLLFLFLHFHSSNYNNNHNHDHNPLINILPHHPITKKNF